MVQLQLLGALNSLLDVHFNCAWTYCGCSAGILRALPVSDARSGSSGLVLRCMCPCLKTGEGSPHFLLQIEVLLPACLDIRQVPVKTAYSAAEEYRSLDRCQMLPAQSQCLAGLLWNY